MNKDANDTIDEATRFVELVTKHLQEKNYKHTVVELAEELVTTRK
jgi:hypothetical protein